MRSKSRGAVIEEWFKLTEGGGLVLPDGWYGRPYDNIHRLVRVAEQEGDLTITLDDGFIELRFEGAVDVRASKSELIFKGFERLCFTRKESVSAAAHSREYESGEVKIIAPPGL